MSCIARHTHDCTSIFQEFLVLAVEQIAEALKLPACVLKICCHSCYHNLVVLYLALKFPAFISWFIFTAGGRRQANSCLLGLCAFWVLRWQHSISGIFSISESPWKSQCAPGLEFCPATKMRLSLFSKCVLVVKVCLILGGFGAGAWSNAKLRCIRKWDCAWYIRWRLQTIWLQTMYQ